MTAPRDEHAAARAGLAAGPWATYGVAPEVWREVADQHAERGELPTAAQVDLATRCGTAAAQAAVEAFALYHELGELLAAVCPAAPEIATVGGGIGTTCRIDSDGEVYEQSVQGVCSAPPARERLRLAGHHAGAVYLDPGDGELVQVLPASAWDPERWGPPAPLPVVRILAPGARDRWSKPGEIAQRDLTRLTLVPERVFTALVECCARAVEDLPVGTWGDEDGARCPWPIAAKKIRALG